MAERSDLALQTLGALARGNPDDFVAFGQQLDKAASRRASRLISCGFFIMSNRRWDADTDSAEVRSWVAEMRSAMEIRRGEIDPLGCESLIAATITDDVEKMKEVGPEKITRLESLILFKLVREARMNEDQIQEFLSETEEMAAEWEAS